MPATTSQRANATVTGLAQLLYASADGAATLSGPLFQAEGDEQLLGVENVARFGVRLRGGLDIAPCTDDHKRRFSSDKAGCPAGASQGKRHD